MTWISIKDQFPEDDYVLVSHPEEKEVYEAFEYERKWYRSGDCDMVYPLEIDFETSFWMPLPKPVGRLKDDMD